MLSTSSPLSPLPLCNNYFKCPPLYPEQRQSTAATKKKKTSIQHYKHCGASASPIGNATAKMTEVCSSAVALGVCRSSQNSRLTVTAKTDPKKIRFRKQESSHRLSVTVAFRNCLPKTVPTNSLYQRTTGMTTQQRISEPRKANAHHSQINTSHPDENEVNNSSAPSSLRTSPAPATFPAYDSVDTGFGPFCLISTDGSEVGNVSCQKHVPSN